MTDKQKPAVVFPPSVLPARSGVYKTRQIDPETETVDGDWGFSYFDELDRVWGCTAADPAVAHSHPEYEFASQTKEWCGLDEEPAA